MAIVEAFRNDTLLAYATGEQTGIVVPLNGESVSLSAPLVVSGSENTQVVLSGTGNDVEGFKDIYVGQVSLTYNRLDLGLLFKGILFEYEIGKTSKASTLYEFLDTFSELCGVQFYPEDVYDVDLTDDTLEKITVKAKATSLNYIGSFDIEVVVPPVDLSTLDKDLNIFVDADAVSDFVYATENGVDKTLPANGLRLTKDVDFSFYATDLDSIRKGSTNEAANRIILGKVMLAEFGIDLGSVTNQSIVTTASANNSGVGLVLFKIPGKVDYLSMKYTIPE